MSTPSDWIRLHSDSFTAAIDPHGAQLSLLQDAAGRDLLWHGDAAFWNGRAPLLFPIVGALNEGHYRWHGQRYALPRHGFARHRPFEIVGEGGQALHLRQTHDAETLKVYPFPFALDVVFALAGHELDIEATVTNKGDVPMPASLGFHPAFLWPLPYGQGRGAHYLEFEFDEPAPVRRLDAAGLLKPDGQPTPVRGRRLDLYDSLFAEDVLIFDQLRSRFVTYGAGDSPRLRVSFPDATHLGLWTKPGAGFVCIEPWRGVADPVGFTGEFDVKPGTFLLPPGGQQSLTLRIETCEEHP